MRAPREVRLIAGAMLLAVTGGCEEIPADVPEIGPLSMPAVVTGRDGGSAAMVGGRMLWAFDDTLMTVFGADGFSYRSATAGWATGASTHLAEALDTNGAPYQLVPYTAAELAYNRAHGPDDRYAMWPNAVVATGPDSALIFFAYLEVLPNGDYDSLGSGVAQLRGGQTVAVRSPELLFANPEPAFQVGSIVVDGDLYLYDCSSGSSCPVGRAPLAQATNHDAWQAWTGTTWSSDLTAAVPVMTGPPGQLSVSWNAYLNSYLAVYSVGLSNEVDFRTAPRPEGPWSTPTYLFTGRHGWNTNYAAQEHPELARDGGRTLVVSYADASEGIGSVIRLALPTLP